MRLTTEDCTLWSPREIYIMSSFGSHEEVNQKARATWSRASEYIGLWLHSVLLPLLSRLTSPFLLLTSKSCFLWVL